MDNKYLIFGAPALLLVASGWWYLQPLPLYEQVVIESGLLDVKGIALEGETFSEWPAEVEANSQLKAEIAFVPAVSVGRPLSALMVFWYPQNGAKKNTRTSLLTDPVVAHKGGAYQYVDKAGMTHLVSGFYPGMPKRRPPPPPNAVAPDGGNTFRGTLNTPTEPGEYVVLLAIDESGSDQYPGTTDFRYVHKYHVTVR